MKHQLDNAIKIIKENGYKYTKKREEILLFLIEENRYVGAIEVFDFMNKQYQGISYDTIYRNLRDFTKMDLLEETELMGEKKFRFHCDVSSSHDHNHHHHHFICTNCGWTKEINLCPMDFFSEQLPDCQIESHRFEILGKCQKCLKK
ncbi:Fur family transcriptional regulator [Vagococcus carniphilus]|uniref:Fur family transcriptional regulator n=1 Tax=Vagococcus carniphilus TaxID=218144 RepID=A0AAW8U8Q3_9ENTE|nr:Fur family transcriptional regulator [Vagococcus carniphilus]MDT2833612.1 Fur family transcriptional regulator [Vagococcus carniphilus]MDT2847565.1 Fur family transcriptional regulator [Vagococcus carniphilus]MDT2865015.1 Fur family transcriptional regulator [Vagococcus carniphilus]